MSAVQLTVYARSDVGRVRRHNEDAYAVSDLDSGERLGEAVEKVDVRDRGVLMVVSDGMGGHAAGEVASELVVESLRSSLSDPTADHSSVQRLIDNAAAAVPPATSPRPVPCQPKITAKHATRSRTAGVSK